MNDFELTIPDLYCQLCELRESRCGLFTLLDTDSIADSDSDSKPDGYIVLSRNYSNYTDSDSNLDRIPDTDHYCTHFGTDIPT